MFIEVILAPDFDPEALRILKRKKKLRLTRKPFKVQPRSFFDIRNVHESLLVQTPDRYKISEKVLKSVTVKEPNTREMEDLLFAWKCVKVVRSNAIVLTRDHQTVGIGGGQMSRVDSVQLACMKAGERTTGAVLASDAFFPMPDSIGVAVKHGISAIIQPGGSIRDQEVIDACDQYNIAMVFTGMRHFKH